MDSLPTGFQFDELETIRHSNFSIVAENEPQAYVQKSRLNKEYGKYP